MRISKSNLFLVVFLLFIIPSILPAQFAGGSGTAEDPYLVATPEHLDNVRNYLDAHFLQIADIDLDVAPYNEGEGWVPLEGDGAPYFDGVYEGGGYHINNLYINRPNEQRIGLFSSICSRGKLNNVKVINTTIYGGSFVGGIAGSNGGILVNCSSSGIISGDVFVGGICGLGSFSLVYCSSSCTVIGESYVGGINGLNLGEILNCTAKGNISGNELVGGLVGVNDSIVIHSYSVASVVADDTVGGLFGKNNSLAINCYWDIETSGQPTSPGGEGRQRDEMTYPYAPNTYVNWDFESVWIGDTEFNNNGYPYKRDRFPFCAGSGTNSEPYLIETVGQLYSVRYLPNGNYNQIADIDLDVEPYNLRYGWKPICVKGNHPFNGTYNGNGHTLSNLRTNFSDEQSPIGLFSRTGPKCRIEYLHLTNIDISQSDQRQDIGGLVGLADSSMIEGVSVCGNIAVGNFVGGIVGMSRNSQIADCRSIININGSYLAGGIAGRNNGLISTCRSSGEISSTDGAGGLVADNYYGEVIDSYSECNLNTESSLPQGLAWGGSIYNSFYNYEQVLINGSIGIISYGALNGAKYNEWVNNGFWLNINDYLDFDGEYYLLTNSYDMEQLLAFGFIRGNKYKVFNDIDLSGWEGFYIPYFNGSLEGGGNRILNLNIDNPLKKEVGLFGWLGVDADIRNLSIIDAYIRGSSTLGILVGTSRGYISNCHVSGTVTGNGYLGGLVGYCDTGTIQNCNSYVTVTGSNTIGGFVGFNGCDILNCYSKGYVYGDWSTGGFSGHSYNDFHNCYSSSIVVGDEHTRGFSGRNRGGEYYNVYWDMELSGVFESFYAEGRTTEDMTYPYSDSTYVEWDFDSTWVADADYMNEGYPYLQGVPFNNLISEYKTIRRKNPKSLTNYPNPFNPVTVIEFSLNERSMVSLSIYNIKGQLVKTLIDNKLLDVGQHTMRWDGKDSFSNNSASGVYFYRLENGDSVTTKKMLLLK